MVFTPNKNLEQPARGSNVGVWDTPVNSNTGIIDSAFGGEAVIALTNSPVTLSASQYQCVFIRFTGVITATISVAFPAVGSFYSIENQTSGAFQVILGTGVPGGQIISIPQGGVWDIKTDTSGNIKFRNFPPVGSYLDLAGQGVPGWITSCTIPPYLYCNGGGFSGATYPALAGFLGGTTLPDHRGRVRFMANDGTGRTTATGGIDGNTLFAAGGLDLNNILQMNIPNYTLSNTLGVSINDSVFAATSVNNGTGSPQQVLTIGGNTLGISGSITGSVTSNGSGLPFAILPPGVVGGIALIRAA